MGFRKLNTTLGVGVYYGTNAYVFSLVLMISEYETVTPGFGLECRTIIR